MKTETRRADKADERAAAAEARAEMEQLRVALEAETKRADKAEERAAAEEEARADATEELADADKEEARADATEERANATDEEARAKRIFWYWVV